MDTPTLGIDFGTTKTLVSYFNPQINRPDLIRLGRGTDYLPTTVFVAQDGGFLFGDDANDEMPHDVKRYSRGFKMRLGTTSSAIGFFDGTRYIKYTAKELTQAFLAHVKEECEKLAFVSKRVYRAVITCPVSFSPAQRVELEDAAHQAGFSEVTLVTEPEAAGLAFCKLCPETCFKGNALVVDWGGGTLDMALVSREGSRVSTHSEYTAGNIEMGGEVFDMRLYNHTARQLLSGFGIDLNQERFELQEILLGRVRAEKEMLSKQEQRTIRLSSSQGACPPVKVTRNEFEQLIAEDVAQAAHMATQLNGLIADAHLKPEMLLLVGGSSRVPCIAKALEQSVGLPCHRWQYSREAVSLGAAWMGIKNDEEMPVNNHAEELPQAADEAEAQKEDISPLIMQRPEPDNNKLSNTPIHNEDKTSGNANTRKYKENAALTDFHPEQQPTQTTPKSKCSITGIWKGSCTNTVVNITVPIEVSFHQDGNVITGYLKIKSDQLRGSGELTGTVYRDSISFTTEGILFIYKAIEWKGSIDGERIQGSYKVVDAKIGAMLKNLMGCQQEYGVFHLTKLT